MGCRALLFHVHSASHSQLDVESSCKEKPFRVIYSECSGNGRGGNEIGAFTAQPVVWIQPKLELT